MGIINVTPDSFSGDGIAPSTSAAHSVVEAAVTQGLRMVDEGADLLDIGGESTRPGGPPIDEETELSRVLPVVRALRSRTPVPLSIDTYRANVARAALDAGADMVNDVWGLRMDPAMAPLVAERRVPVVIMHNRSRPRDAEQEARLGGRYVGVHYDDLMADVLAELRGQIDYALSRGVSEWQIIVDPGIGFGKTVSQSLELVQSAGEVRVLGYPILLGTSRKSFIGYTLGLPPDQRLEGTLATCVAAVLSGGAHILRVHDVGATVRAARMADALVHAGNTS
jgi:dihydropteroate synthase